MRPSIALALGFMYGIIAADPAFGQSMVEITPSLATSQVYDSNLFFAPTDGRGDFITRFTPSIDARYRSAMVTLGSRYTLNMERFAKHPDLGRPIAGQYATLAFHYRPTRRIAFAADAAYVRTQTPGELIADIGLTLGRATAERVTVRSSTTRRFDRHTNATVEYSFANDRIAGGVDVHAHTATLGVDRRFSARNSANLGYVFQRFEFGPVAATTSQVVAAGWTHGFTRRTSLALRAGTRLTGGSVSREISTSVQTHLRPTDLSVGYSRTQTPLIGLAGVADADNLTATATRRLHRRLQLTIAAGVFRVVHGGLESRGYQAAVAALYPVTRALSFITGYDSNFQHGGVYAAGGFSAMSRHVVYINVATAPVGRRF